MSKKTGAHRAQPKRKHAAKPAEPLPEKTYTCSRCGHTRPTQLMGQRKGKPTTICKPCSAARSRERYHRDVEATRARRRALRARDPERYRAQRRARYWRDVEVERARSRERARSERGREINRRAVARYRKAHPHVVAAQKEAQRAARRGEIKVPNVCEILGCECSDRLHLHHPRYDRPRDVIAACRHHHEEIHHRGALRLKNGSRRRWARAPRTDHGHAANASR
jgi:hypothetical protein